MKYIRTYEEINNENAFIIRSKSDEKFIYDIYTDSNNKIYKVESQGDMKSNLEDKLDPKTYIDFVVKLGLGKILDYNFLRGVLAQLPDLYVADVV